MLEMEVTVRLDELICHDEGDGPGTAEPYLWAAYFKVDGETFALGSDGKLHGTVVFERILGDHGNLYDTDVDIGETVAIPASAGMWSTTLRPIPVDPAHRPAVKKKTGEEELPGSVGVAWVLMEEDNLTGSAAVAGYDAFASTLQKQLNEKLNGLGILKPDLTPEDIQAINGAVAAAAKDAIKEELDLITKIWQWIAGPDQQLGSGDFRCSQADLKKKGGRIDFGLRWKDGVHVQDPTDGLGEFFAAGPGRIVESGGEWEIRGHAEGVEVPPAQTYKVECVDSNFRPRALGVRDEAGVFKLLGRDQVMYMITNGDRFYTEDEQGFRAWVSVYEPMPTEPRNYRHLYTTSDGNPKNNLSSMPLCGAS